MKFPKYLFITILYAVSVTSISDYICNFRHISFTYTGDEITQRLSDCNLNNYEDATLFRNAAKRSSPFYFPFYSSFGYQSGAIAMRFGFGNFLSSTIDLFYLPMLISANLISILKDLNFNKLLDYLCLHLISK